MKSRIDNRIEERNMVRAALGEAPLKSEQPHRPVGDRLREIEALLGKKIEADAFRNAEVAQLQDRMLRLEEMATEFARSFVRELRMRKGAA